MSNFNKAPRLFHFLCTAYFMILSSVILLSAELMQVQIFGVSWLFTPGLIVVPFAFFIEGVVTEVYGYSYARSMSQIGFVCLGILILILYLASMSGIGSLQASTGHALNDSYYTVFASIPRHYFSFLVATYLGSLLHDAIISTMKRKWYKALYLRFALAPIAGEFLTDWLGVLMGRLGTLSFGEILQFILFAYLVKLLAEAILYWPKVMTACLVKKYENKDVIDSKNQNYNPLKVDISL